MYKKKNRREREKYMYREKICPRNLACFTFRSNSSLACSVCLASLTTGFNWIFINESAFTSALGGMRFCFGFVSAAVSVYTYMNMSSSRLHQDRFEKEEQCRPTPHLDILKNAMKLTFSFTFSFSSTFSSVCHHGREHTRTWTKEQNMEQNTSTVKICSVEKLIKKLKMPFTLV